MAGPSPDSSRPIRRGKIPELTAPGLIVGYFVGLIIAIAVSYASLILGFSIEGSELAAILGFGILRGALGRRSIIENNINQSIASAVNASATAMMFSVPALFILARMRNDPSFLEFSIPLIILGCITGGVLGIAFIIPLRKQMIDFERLAYPGGIAVATILKSPGAGMQKAMLLILGALISGAVHLVVYHILGYHDLNIGSWLGLPEFMNGIWYVSLMTIGVGFLSGKGGVYFVVGGYVCYWFLAPVLSAWGKIPADLSALGGPDHLRITLFRPVGIGMLVGGALAGVALALPLITSAVRSMQDAAKTKSAVSRDEMPIKFLYAAVLGGFVLLFVIAQLAVPEMTVLRGTLMALLGTLWIWIAGVILSECIGRTNWSPLSGMTLIAVTILILIASVNSGMGDRATIVAAVMVGSAVCVAMSQATDLMLDLKTGYLVGAIPRKQQIAQFAGTWLGPFVAIALVFILNKNSPLGEPPFTAPQASALASIMDGILGGDIPYWKYIAGAGLGGVLSLSGIGGLGILVGLGFYLPFNIVLTYTIGTILRLSLDRFKGKSFSEDVGIPIAAGFIVGEALVGVGNALFQVFKAL
ncbi:MAG: oligopeptide transporter OPT family protein [bacterium]|nr:oligopeptide transporter OPT family protein [bacterium]